MNDELTLGYYCIYKAGGKTLGTCTHVATIFWFMGYARREHNVHYPSLKFKLKPYNVY